MSCPFPPSGGYIESIRSSSRSLTEKSGVTISREGIRRLLKSQAFSTTFNRLSQNHGLALPLKFPSQLAELNLISVLSLVNMGSGYRVPLHNHTGRGAWDSIRALILSLYIAEDDYLSAKGLKSLTAGAVAAMMNVPTHVERPHETIPGVTVGEIGGPLFDLVKLVTSLLNETGDILVSQGYPNLGSLVLEALKEGQKVGKSKGKSVDNEVVLEMVVRAIPGFRDMAVVNGQPVYIFKKALFLLHGIQQRFSKEGSIPIPDSSHLPIFSDNVIPSMLVHLGIINLSRANLSPLSERFKVHSDLSNLLDTGLSGNKMKGHVPREGPVLTESDAYILRASAIGACDIMAEEARKIEGDDFAWLRNITLPEIDAWLWAGGKDRPDYRELERFVLRNTAFF